MYLCTERSSQLWCCNIPKGPDLEKEHSRVKLFEDCNLNPESSPQQGSVPCGLPELSFPLEGFILSQTEINPVQNWSLEVP